MANRATIVHIASIIAANYLPQYTDETIAQFAERVNSSDGWTVEESAPLGGVLRTEGVVLSADDLAAAVQEAERLINS